jgi:hypothetical protein
MMSVPTLASDVVSADTVRAATEADAGPLAAVLAAAFHQDAVAVWIWPDPVRRAELLPGFFEVLFSISVQAGGAYTTAGRDAVLLSTPPGYEPDNRSVRRLIASAAEHGEALEYVSRLQEARRPATPHHYFQFVGKGPDRRSAGGGAALSRHVLDLADREGVPSYAETSSGHGRLLARRQGFSVLGSAITVADGVTLQPMWRAADAVTR